MHTVDSLMCSLRAAVAVLRVHFMHPAKVKDCSSEDVMSRRLDMQPAHWWLICLARVQCQHSKACAGAHQASKQRRMLTSKAACIMQAVTTHAGYVKPERPAGDALSGADHAWRLQHTQQALCAPRHQQGTGNTQVTCLSRQHHLVPLQNSHLVQSLGSALRSTGTCRRTLPLGWGRQSKSVHGLGHHRRWHYNVERTSNCVQV